MKVELPPKPQYPSMFKLIPYWADSYPVKGLETVQMQIGGRRLRDRTQYPFVSTKDQLLFFKEVLDLSKKEIPLYFDGLLEEDEDEDEDEVEDVDEDEDDDESDVARYPRLTVDVLRQFAQRFGVKEETVYVTMWPSRHGEFDMMLFGTRMHTEEEVRIAREPYEKAVEEYERAKVEYNAAIESLRSQYPFMRLPELIP